MAYAPQALRWLAAGWEAAIGSAVLSGIVGDAAHVYGYHRAAAELPGSDYSRQMVGDRDGDGIDRWAADAIDISMSTTDMILVTRRLHASWRDPHDPRLDSWREVIGTLDGRTVIYMDCQTGKAGTADRSHLWHIHAGGLRRHAHDMAAMRAMLSIVVGQTYAQHAATSGIPATREDDVILLAEGPDGTLYCCDGVVSRPVEAAHRVDILHLARTGALRTAAPTGTPDPREWRSESGVWIRLGWSARVFGPPLSERVPVPVTLSDADRDAIAARLPVPPSAAAIASALVDHLRRPHTVPVPEPTPQ
jgi:hypothetical protein